MFTMQEGETNLYPAHLHHDNLELIRYVVEEGRDGLHEAIHGALGAGLEQGGDGERGDGAVHVLDEVLQVQVAGGDGVGVRHGYLAEGADSCEPEERGRAKGHEKKIKRCVRVWCC